MQNHKFIKMSLVMALAAMMLAAGCGNKDTTASSVDASTSTSASETASSESASSEAAKKPIKAEDGYAEGVLGDTLSTYFFDYSVDSADYPAEYEGHTPAEGKKLVDVVISVKNTSDEELPMFNDDFQVQWHDLGEGDEDFGYGVILENSTTVMPAEFPLEKGKSVQYHVVYEVPAEAKAFSVSYLELFDDDTEGDTFFTFFDQK